MGKQKKKTDFQKVKLKVGRHIPKAQNVTDTRFKAKKIILLEQMKQYGSHPEEKRKLDACELLKGLNHSNVSHKIGSLSKLKELLSSENGDAFVYISDILRKTCGLMVDRSSDVRKEALNVIRIVFHSLSEDQMSPLFPVLRSYLGCAATHIDVDVRNDSLKFLDLILDFFPRSVCNSCSVVSSFLDLISYRSEKGAVLPLGSRRLITTPNEKITAQEWRVKVLQRLTKFFIANINILRAENDDDDDRTADVDIDYEKYCIAVQRHYSLQPENMLSFSIKRTETFRDDCCSTNEKFINNFISELMPLLFETWKETVPYSPLGSIFGVVLSREAPIVMITILQVVSYLVEWVSLLSSKNFPDDFFIDFKEKYSKFVQSQLLMNFPFSIPDSYGKHIPRKQMSKQKTSELEVNLEICKVFALFALGTSNCIGTYQNNVLEFLLKVIQRNRGNVENLMFVIEVLKLFLLNEDSCTECEPHLSVIFNIYQHLDDDDEKYDCIRNLFMNLALDLSFKKLRDSPTLQLWLSYLPGEFSFIAKRKQVDQLYLSSLKKIAAFGYPAFIEAVGKQSDALIELLQVSNKNVQEVAALLITKIYSFTPEIFYELSVSLRNYTVSISVIKNILLHLHYRISNEKNVGFLLDDYMSFLLNMCVGISPAEEDEWINKENEVFQSILKHIPIGLSVYTIIPSVDWSYHKDVVSAAVSELCKLPKQESVNACVQSFMHLLLSNVDHIPIHSAAAIFDLYENFVPEECLNKNLELQIANLTLAFYLYEMALVIIPMKREKRSLYSLCEILMRCRKNVTQIFKVILSNISTLCDLEMAHFIGNVVLQLIDTTPLSHTDTLLLTTLMQNLSEILGEEILSETWYKELIRRLSSVVQ